MVSFFSPRGEHSRPDARAIRNVQSITICSVQDSDAITFCGHIEKQSPIVQPRVKPNSLVYEYDPPLPLGQSFSVVELTFGTDKQCFSDSESVNTDISEHLSSHKAVEITSADHDVERLYKKCSHSLDSVQSLEKHSGPSPDWIKGKKPLLSSSCSESAESLSVSQFCPRSEIIVDLSEFSSSQESSMEEFIPAGIQAEIIPIVTWNTLKDHVENSSPKSFVTRSYNIDEFSDDEEKECPSCLCPFGRGIASTCPECAKPSCPEDAEIQKNRNDCVEQIPSTSNVTNLSQYSAYVPPVACTFEARDFTYEKEETCTSQASMTSANYSVRNHVFPSPFSSELVVTGDVHASTCLNHAQWTLFSIILSILTIVKTLIAKQQSLRICPRAI